jgi:hypothetical protein
MGDIPQPLPSIVDLGRLANAAGLDPDADSPSTQTDGEKARGTLLYHREVALRSLLLTFRAKTLSDAAAQLYAGLIAADDLLNFELPAEDRCRNAVTIRRALLSAIPVVAEAAGLDLAEIGAEYIPEYAAREFPAEA